MHVSFHNMQTLGQFFEPLYTNSDENRTIPIQTSGFLLGIPIIPSWMKIQAYFHRKLSLPVESRWTSKSVLRQKNLILYFITHRYFRMKPRRLDDPSSSKLQVCQWGLHKFSWVRKIHEVTVLRTGECQWATRGDCRAQQVRVRRDSNQKSNRLNSIRVDW